MANDTDTFTTARTTRAFIAACMGMAFFGVTMVTLGALLPSLNAKLHLAPMDQTLLAGTESVGILIGSLVFGPLCDRYGHKWLQIASCVMVLAGLMGLTVLTTTGTLAVAVLLVGIGGGVLNGQTNALVSDLYDGATRGARLSLLGAFYGVGAISITLLLYLLAGKADFETTTRGIGVVMMLCIIYCVTVTFPKPKIAQSFPIKKAMGLLSDKALLMLSMVLFFESGIEMVTNTWATTFLAKSAEVSASTALLTLTVMVLALTLARFALAGLLARYKASRLLMCCFGLLMCGFITMLAARGTAASMLAMALIGVGTAATFPVVLGVIGQRYPMLTGTAFGMAITISLIGNTLLNSIMGTVIGQFSEQVMPVVMMLCVALMAAFFTLGNKNEPAGNK